MATARLRKPVGQGNDTVTAANSTKPLYFSLGGGDDQLTAGMASDFAAGGSERGHHDARYRQRYRLRRRVLPGRFRWSGLDPSHVQFDWRVTRRTRTRSDLRRNLATTRFTGTETKTSCSVSLGMTSFTATQVETFILGDAGNDLLYGGSGNDALFGGIDTGQRLTNVELVESEFGDQLFRRQRQRSRYWRPTVRLPAVGEHVGRFVP